MATYKGFWIVFTARDGEVFRDYCRREDELGAAVVDAAKKIEARGIEPRALKVTTEDASVELSTARRLSRHYFFQHARDRSHLRKPDKGKAIKKKHYAPKERQKGSRRDRREKRAPNPK